MFLIRESNKPAIPGFVNYVLTMYTSGVLTHSIILVSTADGRCKYETKEASGTTISQFNNLAQFVEYFMVQPFADGTVLAGAPMTHPAIQQARVPRRVSMDL